MRDQQEKEEILKVTDESSWWIGVYRKLWNWPDRSVSSLALWNNGEPNGGASEPCVVGRAGGWNDVSCGRAYEFMCMGEYSNSMPKNTTIRIRIRNRFITK